MVKARELTDSVPDSEGRLPDGFAAMAVFSEFGAGLGDHRMQAVERLSRRPANAGGFWGSAHHLTHPGRSCLAAWRMKGRSDDAVWAF